MTRTAAKARQPRQPIRGAAQFPAKYNAQSELTVMIQNDSETIDFNLRS